MAISTIARCSLNLPLLRFDYINYKGENSVRTARPVFMFYGPSNGPWHPEPCWIMEAYDINKKDYRQFDMSKMSNVSVIILK